MNNNVFWLLEGAIKPGEFDNFLTVMKAMVTNTQENEPEAIEYEWSVSENKQNCYIYERYANSAAVMNHVQKGAELFQQLVACVNVTSLKVFGYPNDEVRHLLGGLGAIFMTPVGGFIR